MTRKPAQATTEKQKNLPDVTYAMNMEGSAVLIIMTAPPFPVIWYAAARKQ
jgi:hypothetical protein